MEHTQSSKAASIKETSRIQIVFGASDEHRGFEKMGTQLHPKTIVVRGVLANEASSLMKTFFAEKRK